MKCPSCDGGLEEGFLYVRGIGGALFWSSAKDVGFLSRQGLEQIDLSAASVTGTGTQAVLEAWKCDRCKMVGFRSKR
ncbi:MAG: PF20097 family protein [Acidobacteriota bacterium]